MSPRPMLPTGLSEHVPTRVIPASVMIEQGWLLVVAVQVPTGVARFWVGAVATRAAIVIAISVERCIFEK
jgi:hypothetical protein